MAVIRATSAHIALLGRLMRAEAEGEGKLAMLLVGNVGVNRVKSNCLDFKRIRTIPQMVFQRPGGFEAVEKPYFWSVKARDLDKRLARRCVNGERFHPAMSALWFFDPGVRRPCPPRWYAQRLAGRYKSHCFYMPRPRDCPRVF
ncbi:cell wall hydrolase [Effusibacillus pohliae]|uniref:cell wall hydrolase n=1 Tax=Effusibacillus pohliae TaxID=232270 RepID=UPI0003668F0A|nr:cell wall hydrolase [Effusibacillus pohliae]